MTQDRFSAQLRQHLLESANERPADGQLAAVVDAVATTRQRLPLVARLTLNPGRIGLVPSAAVRFGLVAAALALAMTAGALLAGTTRPTTVFEGTWTSTDPGDGSAQILVVGPGSTPAVYFEDGYATGAACVNDVVKRFTARGVGEISGNRLLMAFPDGGGCGLITVELGGDVEYVAASDTLVGSDGLVWTRPIDLDQSNTRPPTTQAPATPTPSPLGDETFTSAIHGISIDYPSGWTIMPATLPWSGVAGAFDSPSVDVLYPPDYDTRLILLIASGPYGDLTPAEWSRLTLNEICGDAVALAEPWVVDGVDSTVFTCPYAKAAFTYDGILIQSGTLIRAEDRGYMIQFLDRGHGARVDTYDEDWFRSMLESVDLRPEDAVDAVPAESPSAFECTDLKGGGTYAANAGSLSLSVTVPSASEMYWQGLRDSFYLAQDSCLYGGPVRITARLAEQMYKDMCAWAGTGVPVGDPAVGAAILAAQKGFTITGPTATTVDGHAAIRIDISVPVGFDLTACTDGIVRLGEGVGGESIALSMGLGQTASLILVDVGGLTLAVTALYREDDRTPALITVVDEIITSMRIAP
ncbi:MAG: hypothetical protein ABIZ52_01790 [Candidatus Limnocylindrales bacterium]